MTIDKGRDWGRRAPLPPVRTVTSDQLAPLVAAADASGAPGGTVRLVGGDLDRTLGSPRPDAREGEEVTLLSVDGARATLDGAVHHFALHLVARGPGWSGPFLVAMNAQYLGPWDVAPRAHPGDGLLDVLEGRLGLGDRLKARSRLPLGTHVPHPQIRERRTARHEATFEQPRTVWLDGARVGRARHIVVEVVPDALVVVA